MKRAKEVEDLVRLTGDALRERNELVTFLDSRKKAGVDFAVTYVALLIATEEMTLALGELAPLFPNVGLTAKKLAEWVATKTRGVGIAPNAKGDA